MLLIKKVEKDDDDDANKKFIYGKNFAVST